MFINDFDHDRQPKVTTTGGHTAIFGCPSLCCRSFGNIFFELAVVDNLDFVAWITVILFLLVLTRQSAREWNFASFKTRSSAVAKRPRDASCLYSFYAPEWKNRRFHVPQPTFLFPLETPLRLSRNMLHAWKDNSMLAEPLAVCTYLSSIVSELYDA